MNILLDECVPARFVRSLTGHAVTTVQKRGWAGVKNGDLLALAENEFDALITVDRRISIERDLNKFKLSIVLLRVRSNRLEDIRPLAADLLEKLPRATAGQLITIGA